MLPWGRNTVLGTRSSAPAQASTCFGQDGARRVTGLGLTSFVPGAFGGSLKHTPLVRRAFFKT